MRPLSVDELLERAASVANLAMLRTYSEPSRIQIAAIHEYTPLLELKLSSLPSNGITRTMILDQLDIHQAILAPIRRLPKELLIDIFFRVANESPFRTLYVAVTLARVCAVWRAVAHGLSKLWSRLVVKSISDFDQYCELFLPITREPNLPGLRCDDPALLKRLWDRVEPYASCWRSITLESQLSALPDLKVLHMENLERLTVNAYDAPLFSDLSALDFVVAPRLRHAALSLDCMQSARQLHIPITQALTSLEITAKWSFPVTLALPLLRSCADTLQTLTLKIRHPSESPEGSYPSRASDPFKMKALTILSLVSPACALLNHIAAPLLDELILSNFPAYGTTSLLDFLARSQASHHLRILRVYQVEEKEIAAWIPCIRLMDSLSQLHFDELLSSEDFLRQLIKSDPPLLPSLEHVAICHVFWNNRDLHDVIGDLCEAREREVVDNGTTAYIPLGWIKD
ncbi:hypothetical protein EV122DRAFT_222136 [Schizophyllum commune]